MRALEIPLINLGLALLPLLLMVTVFVKHELNGQELTWAVLRMLLQLFAVGYFLNYLFSQESSVFFLLLLVAMMAISAWISLRSIKSLRKKMYWKAFMAQLFGATPALLWVVLVIMPGGSLVEARVIIPLAGMVYANAMNTMALAAERFSSELHENSPEDALRKALTAAYIPHINMFMAVGLVSLPGLMTGQILSGVDPLLAVRYQIVVMTMIFSSAGLSSYLFIWQWKRDLEKAPL